MVFDTFFWDIAKFLLEVGCAHINAYGMQKHKARVVQATYEGTNVDPGTIMGAALREGRHAFQSGKKLRPIIQQYFTILFPPHTLSAPATRPSRRQLEELTTSPWEEDNNGHPTASPPRRRSRLCLLEDALHPRRRLHHAHLEQHLYPPSVVYVRVFNVSIRIIPHTLYNTYYT